MIIGLKVTKLLKLEEPNSRKYKKEENLMLEIDFVGEIRIIIKDHFFVANRRQERRKLGIPSWKFQPCKGG